MFGDGWNWVGDTGMIGGSLVWVLVGETVVVAVEVEGKFVGEVTDDGWLVLVGLVVVVIVPN